MAADPAMPTPVDSAVRAAIDDLFARYTHAINNDAPEAWPDFFTADAKYRVTTRENVGKGWPIGVMFCDGRGMMQDRVTALRHAIVFEPHVYRHIVGSVLIAALPTAPIRPRAASTSCAPMRRAQSSPTRSAARRARLRRTDPPGLFSWFPQKSRAVTLADLKGKVFLLNSVDEIVRGGGAMRFRKRSVILRFAPYRHAAGDPAVSCVSRRATLSPKPAFRVRSGINRYGGEIVGGGQDAEAVSPRVVLARLERPGLGRGLDRPYRRELDGARAVPEHGARRWSAPASTTSCSRTRPMSAKASAARPRSTSRTPSPCRARTRRWWPR